MWAKCFIPALCSCYVAGVSQKWNHVEMQGQKNSTGLNEESPDAAPRIVWRLSYDQRFHIIGK